MLYGLEKENKGYCRSKCGSQMCGVYENNVQSVQVFENNQYKLLIRNCDDLFLQPILPFQQPPYLVQTTDSEEETRVRKKKFRSLVFYDTILCYRFWMTKIFSAIHCSLKVHCNYEKKNVCQFPIISSSEELINEVKVDGKKIDLTSDPTTTTIRKW